MLFQPVMSPSPLAAQALAQRVIPSHQGRGNPTFYETIKVEDGIILSHFGF